MTAILSPYSFGIGPTKTLSPSGDATGAKDAAAINTAVAALPAQGGVIRLAATSQWYIACGTVSINKTGVYIDATGCWINATGSGDMIRMFDSSTYGTRTTSGGGILGNPVIDGTSTTGTSSALHIGDILQLQVFVTVQQFLQAGSIGVHFENAFFFSEQLTGRVRVQGCPGGGVVFDASGAGTVSYDRAVIDVFPNQGANQDCVVFQNGAQIVDGRLGIYGNTGTSSSALTSAVLRLTGSHGGANAGIVASQLNIGVEADGGLAHAPQTIAFGSGANNIQAYGLLDFSVGGFTQSNNGGQFNFQGTVLGDPTLPATYAYGAWSQTIATSGTLFAGLGSVVTVSPGAAVTGVILGAGAAEGQVVTVINRAAAANTITFAASGTSNVADGVSDVIAGLTSRQFVWDTNSNLWYRMA